MSLYGVGLDIEVKRIVTNFKILLQKKDGVAIRSLADVFRRADKNHNKVLDQNEFTNALAEFGFFPKIVEIQALMKYYDLNGDHNLSYEEFIKVLREPLSDRRAAIVDKAWRHLAGSADRIPTEAALSALSFAGDKEFQRGTKSAEQIIAEFARNFNQEIRHQEFVDYYADLSMTVTLDPQFVSLIEAAWGVTEDEDASVFKQQVEELTRALRIKCRVITNNSLEEFVLRGIFKDFDTNKSGSLTLDELVAMLNKLQLSVDRKYAIALFKHFDANKNGVIEFDEFCQYLINDPYK